MPLQSAANCEPRWPIMGRDIALKAAGETSIGPGMKSLTWSRMVADNESWIEQISNFKFFYFWSCRARLTEQRPSLVCGTPGAA